jgi:toxin ParE1/3/4
VTSSRVYDYTEETFGAYQAEAYHAGLERTFDLLANFPLIGRPADEIGNYDTRNEAVS